MSPRRRSPLTIEYILLGLLYHAPKHGYELHKEIKESPGLSNIWRIKPSKLYSLLLRLENQGLLVSNPVPAEKTPSRNEFQLTSEGERVFLEWVAAPVGSGRHMRLVFHARLFFALRLGEEYAHQLIDAQRRECQAWVARMEEQVAVFDHPDFTTEQVFAYRISQVRAMLDWLEEVENHIQAGKHIQA